jgi:hypothetical protein
MTRDNVTLHSFDDLKQYGVNPLTGEACAYGRRILCDLSEQGVILLTAYYGLSHTIEARHAFPRNMNGMVGEWPAVAGVMIARAAISDLMVFALLHVGQFDYVLQTPDHSFTGFNEGDHYSEHYLHAGLPEGYRVLHNEAKRCQQPHVGDRNVHAMSGRIV